MKRMGASILTLCLGLGTSTLLAAPDVGAPAFDVAADTASHQEGDMLPVEFQHISCLRWTPPGNLLAGDSLAKQLKVISPAGELRRTIDLDFGPEAVNFAPDGTLYCGGQGRLAKLDASGRLLASAELPTHAKSEITNRRKQPNRVLRVSGIAISDQDVFVAIGSGWSTGSKSKLFRFNRDFEQPVLLAEGLRGCCQRCDIEVKDSVLYLAENGAHRVVKMDRTGQVIAKWGQRHRTNIEGFGSCCNPMNIAFDASGTLYTAESGLGRVKRYTVDGEYLGLVGYTGLERFTRGSNLAASCSNMALVPSPDGREVYVADIKKQRIRVLRKK